MYKVILKITAAYLVKRLRQVEGVSYGAPRGAGGRRLYLGRFFPKKFAKIYGILKSVTHLDSGFRQVNLHRQILSRENVRVMSLGEG